MDVLMRIVAIKLVIFALLALLVSCEGGNGDPRPEPPSNIQVRTTENSIIIDWQDNSTDEEAFVIYREVSEGSALRQALAAYKTVAANTTRFEDSDVSAQLSYRYAVTAKNQRGEAPTNPRDTISPTVQLRPPPGTIRLRILRIGAGGAGTISSMPEGINCDYQSGNGCEADFTAGTTLTLSATADPGSSFRGWQGPCTGTDECTITLKEEAAMQGVITVSADISQAQASLTVQKTGPGSGTVTSTPEGISCGADCSASYITGTVIDLEALADEGSVFRGWGAPCEDELGRCRITLNEDTTITANFTPPGEPPVINSFTEIDGDNTVKIGTEIMLIWDVSAAVSLTLNPGAIDVTGSSFYKQTMDVEGTTTFRLTATNATGVSSSRTYAITAGFPVEINSFTVNGAEETLTVPPGTALDFEWSVSGSDLDVRFRVNSGVAEPVIPTGSETLLAPTEAGDYSYSLIANNDFSLAQTATLSVTVEAEDITSSLPVIDLSAEVIRRSAGRYRLLWRVTSDSALERLSLTDSQDQEVCKLRPRDTEGSCEVRSRTPTAITLTAENSDGQSNASVDLPPDE